MKKVLGKMDRDQDQLFQGSLLTSLDSRGQISEIFTNMASDHAAPPRQPEKGENMLHWINYPQMTFQIRFPTTRIFGIRAAVGNPTPDFIIFRQNSWLGNHLKQTHLLCFQDLKIFTSVQHKPTETRD